MATTRRKSTTKEGASDSGLDREGLLVALSKLKPALRTGGALPELGHVWFVDGHASAYDGGLGIRLALDLGVSCGVPGRPLLGLLGTSSLKNVSLKTDKTALVVQMGRSRTKLNVLEGDRNPWPFDGASEGETAHLSEAFVEALRSVLIVKATPATRIEHHGVFVYCEGKAVDIFTTDGTSLACASFDEAKASLPDFAFIPRPLAEQIVALCPHGGDLITAPDHFAVEGRGVEVCSNVLDTEGISDVPAILDKQLSLHPDQVDLPAGMEAALDRAEVLAGGSAAIVTVEVLEGRMVRLSGKYTYGELREELELSADHPQVTLQADAGYLRKGLLAADTFSATEGSLIFYRGESFIYVVAAS